MFAEIWLKSVEGRVKDEIVGSLACEAECPKSCRGDKECVKCCDCVKKGSSPFCSDKSCTCAISPPPLFKNIYTPFPTIAN